MRLLGFIISHALTFSQAIAGIGFLAGEDSGLQLTGRVPYATDRHTVALVKASAFESEYALGSFVLASQLPFYSHVLLFVQLAGHLVLIVFAAFGPKASENFLGFDSVLSLDTTYGFKRGLVPVEDAFENGVILMEFVVVHEPLTIVEASCDLAALIRAGVDEVAGLVRVSDRVLTSVLVATRDHHVRAVEVAFSARIYEFVFRSAFVESQVSTFENATGGHDSYGLAVLFASEPDLSVVELLVDGVFASLIHARFIQHG